MNTVEWLVSERISLSLHWNSGLLRRIRLLWSTDGDVRKTPPVELSEHGKAVAGVLARYAAGERVSWPDLPFDFEKLTPFVANVLKTLLKDVGSTGRP